MAAMVSILKLNCPDAVGLLAQITGAISHHGGNLLEVSQYTDLSTGWFSRLAVEKGHNGTRTPFRSRSRRFLPACERPGRCGRRRKTPQSTGQRTREIALWICSGAGARASSESTCLVISNHETCRPLVEREKIPFEFVPFEKEKMASFEKVGHARGGAELVVLARFMQSSRVAVSGLRGPLINIHPRFSPICRSQSRQPHSARREVNWSDLPLRHRRVGRRSHYRAEVARVEHYHDPEDLVRLGRDCERLALARGVRYHVEHRVLVHGSKAIVFRD
jgi:formyltetrahydrofolate deformylase